MGDYVRIKKVYTGFHKAEARRHYIGRIARVVYIDESEASYPYKIKYLDIKLEEMKLSQLYTFRYFSGDELELATEDEAMAEMI